MTIDPLQLTFGSERRHSHLRLAVVLSPYPRHRPPRGGPSTGYPDPVLHARVIRRQLDAIRERHAHRVDVLGIHPDLVMVIVFHRGITGMDEQVQQAGLQFLAATGNQAIAAFSSDPEMTAFLDRLREYGEGTATVKTPRHERLFGVIREVRSLAPDDVLDPDVRPAAVQRGLGGVLRVDVQCWCPEDEPDARRRFTETLSAVQAAGGTVIDSSFRYPSGLSLIRADVPADAVVTLARTDRVRWISLLPRPLLSTPEMVRTQVSDLPPVVPPVPDAPIVAVIDSGVRAAHPLLAPALLEAVRVSEHVPDGNDEHGHGTLVASLALYGSLESRLRGSEPLRPAGRLLSVRVLDDRADFPDAAVWSTHLVAALQFAAERGARVVNLSLGDGSHPYHPPGPEPVAAMIDAVARIHDLVAVVSAGNFPPADYIADADIASGFVTWLLEHEDAGILPPATAALAVTTGALVAEGHQGARPRQDSVDVRLIGRRGGPSPATRVGPGIENMIKPELSAPGGTYAYDAGLHRFAETPYGMVVGAGGHQPDRLLASDVGTSFAAPLVSHAALRVLNRYPGLSANAVRAVLLATVEDHESVVDGGTRSRQLAAQLRLVGFGRVSGDRAEFSGDYRAVLVAEDELAMDQVHFYVVPVPDAFFVSGKKTVRLGFSFDPEVRATRLQYVSNRMSVFVYRGVPVEDVRAKFAAHAADEGPPEELEQFKCDLQPSNETRTRGVNHAASQSWTQSWRDRYRGDLVVVVRNTNRWARPDTRQRYALALTLETSEMMEPALYAQLRARLPLLAEIEPEIEL